MSDEKIRNDHDCSEDRYHQKLIPRIAQAESVRSIQLVEMYFGL